MSTANTTLYAPFDLNDLSTIRILAGYGETVTLPRAVFEELVNEYEDRVYFSDADDNA